MKDITTKERQDIKDNKIKKLIFVFSDGGSDEEERLKVAIDNRRKQGVYVYGIGIGDDADVTHYLTNQKNQ
jgi:nicotinic acid phosphoribosyltransferase